MDAAAGLAKPPNLEMLNTPRSGRTVASTVVVDGSPGDAAYQRVRELLEILGDAAVSADLVTDGSDTDPMDVRDELAQRQDNLLQLCRSNGLRLKRRWMLVRQTDGAPLLWVQRQRMLLFAPPSSGLRFDVLEEVPATRPT